MFYLKRITSVFILLFFLLTWPLPASAVDSDPERMGSLQLKMEYQETPLPGGSLSLYRVADADGTKCNLAEEFRGSGVDISKINDPDTAKALARYAADQSILGTVLEIGEMGTACFTGLRAGVYLLVQQEAAPGFMTIRPFLVQVPMAVNDEYFYDILAEPKCEQETKPQPNDSKLPQTGQLNWLIPVLAVLGLGLCGTGWYLSYERRDMHEK